IAWICGYRSFFSLAILGSFATIVLFAAAGAQNFNFGMQFIFVLAWTSTTGAVAALASYANGPARWKLGLAATCCILAVLSLGNGFLAGYILTAMAWRLRLDRRVIFFLAALALLCTAAWLAMPGAMLLFPIHISDAPLILAYWLRVIGGVPAQVF